MKLEHEHLLRSLPVQDGSEQQLVLLITRSQTSSLQLQAALAPLENVKVEAVPSLGNLRGSLLNAGVRPLIAVVESDPEVSQDLDLIRDVRKTAGSEKVSIIALIDREAPNGALQVIRAGADDVLLKPIDLQEARETFARVIERLRPAPEKPASVGKLIAFMHFSGGAGATTLAVNSASALASAAKDHAACLLDLDIQFGNAANLLDLPTASPVHDLLDDPSRLDDQMLDSMMLRHATGLHVLSAPRELLPLTIYGNAFIAAILARAKRRYEFVVVDLPSALASWTDTVLHMASVINIVTPLTVPAAHRVCKFLQLLRMEGITGLPFKVVANRYQRSNRHSRDISVAQFEKATGLNVDFLMPNDDLLVSMSHGQGKPAVTLKPHSPFSEAIKSMLAAELDKDLFGKPRRGFFSRSS